ncbi:MAG TPA: hypothetical protein VFZ59_00245 [Verrucomicrobiae bacterium]|nr:hypothetical protein [Verrucomicrobiae bacterium]
MKIKPCPTFLILTCFVLFLGHRSLAQGNAVTYQGRLNTGVNPATGIYDFEFSLFADATGGSILDGPLTNLAVSVSNGLFTAEVNFGKSAFPGDQRWLEIGVRSNGTGGFVALSPRQKITYTPYALRALNAESALVASGVEAGGINAAAIAPGSITADKLASNSVGLGQLSRRYLSGAIPYSALPSSYFFATAVVEQQINFAVPFNATPVITLTTDTPHPGLPAKGALLISTRSTNGFKVRVPAAPVGVEIARGGEFGVNRPTIRVVNGNPAVVGTAQVGLTTGLLYSRSTDTAGANWPTPVILASGFLTGSSLDMAGNSPAITFIDALGGISFVRANDTNGTSWPSPTQIVTPTALGGGAGRFSGGLVNGNPALLTANFGNTLYFLRANDAIGSSWGPPAVVFTAPGNLVSSSLAMVSGRPAYAAIASNTVYYARANDANGSSWPAPATAVSPNSTNNLPIGSVTLLDTGRPFIGYMTQVGVSSPNLRLLFTQGTDAIGTSWEVSRSITEPSPTAFLPSFNLAGGLPVVSYAQNGKLYLVQSFAVGPSYLFPAGQELEPGIETSMLEMVNGQLAIAFHGNGSLRFIRQGTPPPNSAINWIAVEQ